jgi:uncharacterized protein (TIGR03437 family)
VSINATVNGAPATQAVTLSYQTFTEGAPSFVTNFNTNQGAGWISVSPSSGTMTQASLVGLLYTYSATVNINVDPTGVTDGTSETGTVTFTANGNILSVPVTMNVVAAPASTLSVSPLIENLSVTQGMSATAGQVTVSASAGTLQYSAQVAPDQGNWLRLAGSGSGVATPSAPSSLGFVADPTGLAPGLYTGQITVADSNSSMQTQVTVTLAVNQAPQMITTSQAGLTVSAVAGGQTPPSQSFTISSEGSGSLAWTVTPQTISNPLAPSADWLSVSPSSGVSVGGQPGSPVTVSVSTAGLPVGQYYGSVNIDAPNAVNNPQSLLVLLNVTAAADVSNNIGFSAGGVILAAPAGTTTPQQQTITLFNPSNATVNYTATSMTSNGTGWLGVAPASGPLPPGSTTISVTANMTALPAGLQTGTVNFAFDNGSSAAVQVAVIATGGVSGSVITGNGPALRALTKSSACAGGRSAYLVPIVRQPVAQSMLRAALPQKVQLQIVDDCGNSMTAASGGAAQVSFGDQDTSVDLHDVGGGIWEGTWIPVNTATSVALQAVAFERSPQLSSVPSGIALTVLPAASNPEAQISGVVNAASSGRATPQIVTPGSYVAIYGTSLAPSGGAVANSIPLPAVLNDTKLFLGGQSLPLIYAGSGQINALIPRNLNPNASYQLVVQRGSTMSVPIPLTVAQYQPGIYTFDLSGAGQGIVEIAGTTLLAAPNGNGSRPAHRGSEYLAIFATGLGPVLGSNGEAPPADGAAAPLSTVYQTTGNVTATVGGVNAIVVFSGLTPSLVGLYQVNVLVPAGAPAGDAVPLTLTVTDPVSGQAVQSNTVTIAVQ